MTHASCIDCDQPATLHDLYCPEHAPRTGWARGQQPHQQTRAMRARGRGAEPEPTPEPEPDGDHEQEEP